MNPSFGEILVEHGKLDRVNLARARAMNADASEVQLALTLTKLGLVSGRDIADAVSAKLGLPVVEARDYPELPLLEERVSPRFLKESQALPLREDESGLLVAMVDPGDRYVIDALKLATGRNIDARIANPADLENAFQRLYGSGETVLDQIVGEIETREDAVDADDVAHLKDMASEAPVIRLVNLILSHALELRASDIHIEPFESRLILRYRVDGVLHEGESPPRRLSAAVISRIKIMANLDIAERRLPQDGRIRLRIEGRELDLRVSTVPTMHGESLVMRILDKGGVALEFGALGFEPDTLARFTEALARPHGILLVTGPTGSGKTTTLYTALTTLNRPGVKILTVEDPVEYQVEGINQIQVKPQIDLSFANALRSIVRQDPDVIMIGEIRDVETAEIALQSALTGHLVLSTLHTNDAPGTVNRLLDMGAKDFLLTSALIGIQAQRLVRTLCTHCREPYPALAEMVSELGLRRFSADERITLYRPAGCERCGGTGYHGRVGIIEFLSVTDRIRSLIMRHAAAGEMREAALAEGMHSMYEDGLAKSLRGVTTVEEVLRVTREV
ncbi:MAG: type II secretion system ATPase GspE [Burkholderiales bacterium]|nr:type II secretion system ATPase GspE [Burkholderiales bacterium]